jgi:hypothetical protein
MEKKKREWVEKRKIIKTRTKNQYKQGSHDAKDALLNTNQETIKN